MPPLENIVKRSNITWRRNPSCESRIIKISEFICACSVINSHNAIRGFVCSRFSRWYSRVVTLLSRENASDSSHLLRSHLHLNFWDKLLSGFTSTLIMLIGFELVVLGLCLPVPFPTPTPLATSAVFG